MRTSGGSGTRGHAPEVQSHEHAAKQEVLSRPTCSSGRRVLSGSADGRRHGLPLHAAGVQLATDTTLVGALRGDGTTRRGAAVTGVALAAARWKERRCPELVGPSARSRLVVERECILRMARLAARRGVVVQVLE